MSFQGNVVFLGFGCVGQAVLPLLLNDLKIAPQHILIISKTAAEAEVANTLGIRFERIKIDPYNYLEILSRYLMQGDFLLNLSTGISSYHLISFCKERKALYLDASTEPWEGLYNDASLTSEERTNYALRESVMQLDKKGPTAILTHGANPGLVSHFVKQALVNLAQDNQLKLNTPSTQQDWANLAQLLGIKSIHIAERDTQISRCIKKDNTFFNTWSIDGLVSEAIQPAELSWGTHERHWPDEAKMHTAGSQCAIYLDRPGASVLVRTWTPSGPTHGYLISHAEAMSIADYLTVHAEEKIIYRPTVHYAYSVSPQTKLSLIELVEREYKAQDNTYLMLDDVDGADELGILLMGHAKGAYWFGSVLNVDEAKKLAPYNNATSLQVAAGVLGAMKWAILYPNAGIVEPEDLDHHMILAYASPYLGLVKGVYTNWTPLDNRKRLFKECLDEEDPWQFLNMRVR